MQSFPNSVCDQCPEDFEALKAQQVAKPGSKFAVDVIADPSGKYCGNGVRRDTLEQALEYAEDLYSRWMLVKKYRVILKEAGQ